MSDLHGHHPSARETSPSGGHSASLTQWIRQVIEAESVHVRSRLRGNNLHILLESKVCPEASEIVPKLAQALTSAGLEAHLPSGSPQVYQVFVYGRQLSESMPAWTETFYINQPLEPVIEPLEISPQKSLPLEEAAGVQSIGYGTTAIAPLIQLARAGQPGAIARYLSSVFSDLGVSVKAKIETLRAVEDCSRASDPDGPIPEGSDPSALPASTCKRLFIACESAYSPDPVMLAEPIAQHLRELELQGFQDAVVFGQVRGETRPEWLLRVDLTPTDQILQEWARWGDVQAIARLLNRLLLPQAIRVSALLKEATLHLTCQDLQATAPDKLTAIALIAPMLDSLSPQGIRGATVYGVMGQETTGDLPSPQWIHWLDLPAVTQPDLAPSTLELAHQGNLEAISFLLTRLLNPNLDRTLATGGIRVQIRRKGDLLHIMTDAPTCPNQGQVAPEIARFLKPIGIPGMMGVRIYGRRAGQKQPLWSYGIDFASRSRLVPEATPEFAASDAYVGDLLSPPGALVLRSDLPVNDWRSLLNRWIAGAVEGVQRSLIRSQLFIPVESAELDAALTPTEPQANPTPYRGGAVALVWGTVGLLLVVQSDWLLGQAVQPPPPKPAPVNPSPSPSASQPLSSPAAELPPEVLLPNLSLQKSRSSGERDTFNSSGFTQPGTKTLTDAVPAPNTDSANADNVPLAAKDLPASPLQPKTDVAAAAADYPSFNSRQLDERIALYQQYVAKNGAPDVLIIGSSRALRGVDPVALQKFLAEQGYAGVSVFNFGINGATAQVVDLLVRQVIPQEKLPKLILFADGARAFNSGRQDITYNGIVASEGYRTMIAGRPPIPGTTLAQAAKPVNQRNPAAPMSVTEEPTGTFAGSYQAFNRELDQRLGALSQAYSNRDRLKSLLRDQLSAVLPSQNLLAIALGGKFTPEQLSDATSPAASASNSPPSVLVEGGTIDVDGFLPLSNRFNPATYYQKYARVLGDYDSDYESFSLDGQQADAMIALVQFAQAREIPFVFANLPLTNDYLDPVRKRHEDAFQQYMLQLATQIGFTYRDLSLSLATQPDYFSDPSHLNRYGAYEVSRQLAADVMIPWQKVR